MNPIIKQTIKHLAISFTFLFIISLTLELLNYLPSFWQGKNLYLFYIALFFISFHFFLKIKSIPSNQRDKLGFIKFISYMFLLSLATLALNQFLKRQFILDYQIPIVAVSIALGILTFYSNRDKVESDLENEKKAEDAQEAKRKAEFSKKFPTINKVWGLRALVRWMYVEGWWYSVGLIAIVILGFVLRVWKIKSTKLLADEGYVALAVRGLYYYTLPVLPSNLVYPRGILFSYITYFSTLIFGYNEFSLRFWSILTGTLIIIVVYFLMKEINNSDKSAKFFGLFTSLFVAFHPLFVEFSRFSRWHMLIALLYLTSFLIYIFFEKTKKLYLLMINILILCILPFTGEHGYLSPLFACMLFLHFWSKNKSKINKKIIIEFLVILFLISSCVLIALYFERFSYYNGVKSLILDERNFLNMPEFTPYKFYSNLKNFFDNLEKGILISGPIIIIASLVNLFSSRLWRYSFVYLIPLVSISMLVGKTNVRTYFFIIPFLIIGVASLIYGIYKISRKNKTIYILSIFLTSFFIIISVQSFTLNNFDRGYGVIKNSNFLPSPLLNYNPDLDGARDFIKENYGEGDIIISSLKANLYFYLGDLDFWVKKVNIIDTTSPLYLYEDRTAFLGYISAENKKISHLEKLNLTKPIYIDSVSGAIVLSKERDIEMVFNKFERIWVVKSIFDENPKTVGQIYYKLLSDNKEKIVYYGRDDITNVYLFTKEDIK